MVTQYPASTFWVLFQYLAGTLPVSCQYLMDTHPIYPASILWIHSPCILPVSYGYTAHVSCQYLTDTQPMYPASILWIHSPCVLPVSYGYTAHISCMLWSYGYTAHTLPVAWQYLMGTLQVPFRHSLLPVPYWYLAGTLLLSHCGDPKGSEACKLLTSLWFLNEENKQETATVYTWRAFFAWRFCLPLVVNEENNQEVEEVIHCEELFGLAFFFCQVFQHGTAVSKGDAVFSGFLLFFLFFYFFMTLPIMPSHLPIRCGWVSGMVPRILIAFVNGCGVVLDFLVLLFLPHLSLVSLAYTHFSIVFDISVYYLSLKLHM